MSGQGTRSTLDGLPKQFVASMRTLFDIMDDKKMGYIRFSDIESRWREDDDCTRRLPKGVVESLRKVTPANGLLSFERFCAGLKICLLRNRGGETVATACGKPPLPMTNSSRPMQVMQQQGGGTVGGGVTAIKKSVPSQSVPPTVTRPLTTNEDFRRRDVPGNLQSHKLISPVSSVSSGSSTGPQRQVQQVMSTTATATVRPSVPLRAVSMPLLGNDDIIASQRGHGLSLGACDAHRSDLRSYTSDTKISSSNANNFIQSSSPNYTDDVLPVQPSSSLTMARNRKGIMTVLHNWHMGMLNELENKKNLGIVPGDSSTNMKDSTTKFGSLQEMTYSFDRNFAAGVLNNGDTEIGVAHSKVSSQSHHLKSKGGNSRRREPRRHTLANGIDYNMLKRMKQLEQEKDILLQGLEAVDKARAWYLTQIVDVQDKMKFIGHNNNLEYSTEAHQERLNFQMAQIFEVNQSLSALVESSERGFPLHMNLALRQQPMYSRARLISENHQDDISVHHLKELNHLLTEEVSKKSERISELEMEKAALVRELFQARSQVHRESDDATLM